jgi:hypothetical protein
LIAEPIIVSVIRLNLSSSVISALSALSAVNSFFPNPQSKIRNPQFFSVFSLDSFSALSAVNAFQSAIRNRQSAILLGL